MVNHLMIATPGQGDRKLRPKFAPSRTHSKMCTGVRLIRFVTEELVADRDRCHWMGGYLRNLQERLRYSRANWDESETVKDVSCVGPCREQARKLYWRGMHPQSNGLERRSRSRVASRPVLPRGYCPLDHRHADGVTRAKRQLLAAGTALSNQSGTCRGQNVNPREELHIGELGETMSHGRKPVE